MTVKFASVALHQILIVFDLLSFDAGSVVYLICLQGLSALTLLQLEPSQTSLLVANTAERLVVFVLATLIA